MVWIDGGYYKSRVTDTGHFKFQNLKPGMYSLEVISPHLYFDKVRINIYEGDEQRYNATYFDVDANWDRLGTQLITDDGYITISPKFWLNFKVQERSMLFAMMKSPLVIISILTVLFSVLFPKLIDYTAESQKRELARQAADASNEEGGESGKVTTAGK